MVSSSSIFSPCSIILKNFSLVQQISPTHIVLNEGCVVDDVDLLNGHSGHLSNEYPSEGVGHCRVHSYHVKLHLIIAQTHHVNTETLERGGGAIQVMATKGLGLGLG